MVLPLLFLLLLLVFAVLSSAKICFADGLVLFRLLFPCQAGGGTVRKKNIQGEEYLQAPLVERLQQFCIQPWRALHLLHFPSG